MIKQVYCFEDVKVSVFHPPMVMLNDAEARRLCADIVADPNAPMCKHPDDFRLVKVATFNDNSGLLSAFATPEFICSCSEFVINDK